MKVKEYIVASGKAVWRLATTLLRYSLGLLVGIFCAAPLLLSVAILPPNRRGDSKFIFWLLDLTYRSILWALWMPISIEGQEHIPEQAAIWVANHESALDIPVLGSLLRGRPHLWFVLARFVRTPFLGFFVQRMCIPVEQTSAFKASRALIQGIRTLENHERDVLIFPEGGRWTDGKIHPFFQGFAVLAQKTKRPVVPVIMYNLGKIYPPHAFFVDPHSIRVVIGEPFVYDDADSLETFSQRVYEWFVAQK